MTAKRNPKYGRWAIGLVLLAGFGVLVVSVGSLATNLTAPEQPFVYYTVAVSDLPIVVTERGNLESQQETTIRCEVESRGYDRSGTSGTQIIFIVPNGSSVQEGDLLVEFDSAPIREALDTQIISHEHAQASKIQAEARYENQITQNKTAEENAALKVRLAELALEMFTDEASGTHKLEVEEINRSIEDTNNEILSSQANLELKRNDKLGIESLFKLGYAGKSELDRSRLDFLQAESQYASRMNRLKTQLATRTKKETFEREMKLLELHGTLDTARRNQEQVAVDNVSALAQAKASLDAATRSLDKEKERLDKLEAQLAVCKIYAPHDGMVVYQSEWGRDPIAEGTFVRERQRILALPNLSKMQVKAFVHESVLDQVQRGQRATVRVDAFPDRTYRAVVDAVGVVPADRGRYSGDVKTYETVVLIEGTVEQLKPGMTAVVEIHVDRIKDALAVPVQAVVQIDRDTWCYVEARGGVEQRPLELGRTNDKFVQVRKGLAVGDRVVLNPSLILERQERAEQIGPDVKEPAPLDEIEALASAAIDPGETASSEGAALRNSDAADARGEDRAGTPNPNGRPTTASAARGGRPRGSGGSPGRAPGGAPGGTGRPGGPPLRGPSAGQ